MFYDYAGNFNDDSEKVSDNVGSCPVCRYPLKNSVKLN